MRLLLVFALVFVLPFAALASDYQGKCSIVFQASSTLHDFEGTGNCEPFTVSENSGVLNFPELSVAVSGMDTDNSKRDKQMRKMFYADLYPLITGSAKMVVLRDIRNSLKESGDSTAEVVFDLKIRENQKTVKAVLQHVVEADSTITANLVFSLSLAEFKLEPPSILGFIRVADKIDVTTSFTLDAQ